MFFIGYSYFGDGNSFSNTATDIQNTVMTKLSCATYDDIYVTKATDGTYNTSIWDKNTYLHATFDDGQANAGNIAYILANTKGLLVKRRKKDTYDWTNIYYKETVAVEDFSFSCIDVTPRANVNYDYAIVPIGITGIEGDYNYSSIKCTFEGLVIVDKDMTFQTFLDITVSTDFNMGDPSTITTLDNKYPYVVDNSDNDYDTIEISCGVLKSNSDCTFEANTNWDYNNIFRKCLTNKKAKIIKLYDGRIWLCRIVGKPRESQGEYHYYPNYSFSVVEIGNYESTFDLWGNGIINIDERWVN